MNGLPRAARPPGRARAVVPHPNLDLRTVLLGILTVAAVCAVLRLGRDVLVPLTLALLGSYVLEPLVAALVRLRLPRSLAAAIVMLSLVAAMGASGWWVADDAVALVQRLPQAARRFGESVRALRGPSSPVASVEQLATEIERTTSPPPPKPGEVPRVRVEEPPVDVRALLLRSSLGAGMLASQGLLLLFLVYFLLASGKLFKRKLVRLAGPSLRSRRLIVRVLDQVDASVQGFLVIMAVTSVFVGVASWLVFRALGLEQAGVWGLVAGVLNVIPWVGTVVPVVGVALVAFLQFGTWSMTALVALGAVLVQVIEGGLLTPKLVGRTCRMNDVAVFTSLLVWGWLWGLAGLLLAVPIMMALKAVCDHVEDLRPLGELLGDE